MVLTIEEKKKLLEKATQLYMEIKNIKIRKTIELSITPKYYPSNSKFSNCGFKYYFESSITMYAENIENALKNLEKYIEEKENGEKFSYISQYEINALLDFIYYNTYILDTIENINNKERKELDLLLN